MLPCYYLEHLLGMMDALKRKIKNTKEKPHASAGGTWAGRCAYSDSKPLFHESSAQLSFYNTFVSAN